MNKAILIHAGMGSRGFNSCGKGMDESWINHGLASIGAYLKLKGYEFRYLDLRKFKSWTQFLKEIHVMKPDIAGISATTVDYDIALKVAGLIKSVSPSKKTVLGGIHASVCPDECSTEGNFDHLIVGEGEVVFREIIEGKIFHKIIRGKPIEDLNELPFIDRDIFGKNETPIYPTLFPKPFSTFIASRGCPYNCSFCQPAERIVFGRKMRSRSPENLVDEIEKCKKDLRINSYLIHDDCMLWNIEWVENFLSALSRKNLKMPFAIQSRADLISKYPDLIKGLKMFGLTMILIGFESGSQKILDFLKKGTTVEHNFQAAKICRNNNVAIWANYMFGIPEETKSDVTKTVEMIREIKPEVCSPSFFTPYPGTYLSQYCDQRNLSLIGNYTDFRRNPEGRKIRGIDYHYLRKAVRESKNETLFVSFLKKAKKKIKRF
ncbi:MAG: B12-binding domain-containing radical SAM protein [Candidatus Aminicenantes bacterium]|nr:B12-binding domain-containing radical SAM protein [Candidatus Aminicenantes bacterium]